MADLFDENSEYSAFVEKFKPKKTTDDCYTPPEIYEAVRDWVCGKFGIDPAQIVRPFYPGGDYQAFEYPPGAVVLDNPPFSIYSQIVRWYAAHNIRFFIFAPALTLMSCGIIPGVSNIAVGVTVTYDNGAEVNTSFAHNLGDGETVLESCPELYDVLKAANDRRLKSQKKQVRKLAHPVELITAARVNWLSIHHTQLRIRRRDCVFIRGLDNDRSSIFGGGLLLTSRAAAERAAAERAAAERAAAEHIELSDREREALRMLERMNGDQVAD